MQLQATTLLLTFLTMLSSTTLAVPTLPVAGLLAGHAKAAATLATPAQGPWVLSNITIFEAKPSTAGASYLHFTFSDTRQGLKLTTDCRRFVLPAEGPEINDPANAYPCRENTVGFTYNQGNFDIVRNYRDASVGPPGLDNVIAYGGASATFTTTNGGCGIKQTLGSLPAQITALAA